MKNAVTIAAVLALTAGAAFAKAGQPAHTTSKAKTASKAKAASTPKRIVLTCAVMGSKIASPKMASGFSDYKGTRYYFCCKSCKPEFDKNPAKYAAKVK